MAQSSFPFENVDTTETQFSQMFRTLNAGVNGTPAGTELKVSAGTGLQVSVALGQAMVRGHYYISTATELLTIGTANPSNPRIDTVVLRLDPVANSIVLAVVAGTAAASPVAPTLTQTDAGVFEFPLANVAVAAGAGTVGTITDRRVFMGKRLQSVGTSAARDIVFPAPVQGDMVWRDDLGVLETYYGLYNASTNPGGRDAAGWYSSDRAGGLVPIRPTSATFVTGSGAVKSTGLIDFTGCTQAVINGVFSSRFTNYKIVISNILGNVGGGANVWFRFAAGGTIETGNVYYGAGSYQISSPASTGNHASQATFANAAYAGTYTFGGAEILITQPFISGTHTGFYMSGWGDVGSGSIIRTETAGDCVMGTAFDGFAIIASSGIVRAKVQVFGWNE